MADVVSERAQHLLRLLVERYIRDGQPVSSKSLAEDKSIALSPATIRNVLADLEERGYLRSLHASSGRVPTGPGYRLFVNSLLSVKPIDDAIYQEFRQQLSPEQSVNDLITNASQMLSRLTHMTGLVTMPRVETIILQQIEFVPLSNNRVLVILILNEKEVQNRIIQTERNFTRAELERVANFLNEAFSGKSLDHIQQQLLLDMQDARHEMDQLMQAAIKVATNTFEKQQSDDYILSGEHNLLDLAVETDLKRMQQLFSAFNQKRDLLYILQKCQVAEGIQIFVGEEAGYEMFDGCSMVTSPYQVGDTVVGALAVIGPTRMPYDKVIPIVDVSAKLLSLALSSDSHNHSDS